MSLFKSLTKAVLGTALLPVDVVADTATLGGLLSDKERTYTGARAAAIMQNLKDVTEPSP